MAGVSKFKKAVITISTYFHEAPKRVFSHGELTELLDQKKKEWGLSESMYTRDFIGQLTKHLNFKTIEINGEGHQSYVRKNMIRYAFGDVSPFEVALSIRANTYLSHLSSMFLLGLTEQIPRVIYLTFEQTPKPSAKPADITQERIDAAFEKPQREPDHYFTYLDYQIILLNGKYSGKAGVTRATSIFGKNLPLTNLERTLIDSAVRPAYSGGITEVLKAYERAADHLSTNKLLSILTRLDYIYPYHQAIGYYLQKAQVYKPRQIELFRELPMPFDFYLTYNMPSKQYAKEWRLYYPANF